MLRFFVLILLLLNAGYFAWSQGLLRAYGWAPVQQTEPERLARQIRAQALQVQPLTALPAPPEPAPAPTPPPASAPELAQKPTVCLQAGVFNEAQSARLRNALVSMNWPTGAWVLDTVETPGRWIIYMGRYANAEALAKKRAELIALNLKLAPFTNPMLQPGLSLGAFDNKAAADAGLAALARQGVRTARVLQERPEGVGTVLRLPAVDESLRDQLSALKPVLAGKPLGNCR